MMIAIILCTYNGECYLETQLKSLQNQTYKDIIIYIHDDGSSDSTMQIVESFADTSNIRCKILKDDQKNRGAGPSFMWALSNIEADYYMFCDQDDFWFPTKVEHTYMRMREVESQYPDTPILIHTDLKLTDGNLNVTYDSFWDYQNFNVDISKRKQFISFGNIVTGCTMIINNDAKICAFPYNGEMLHDYWIALKVAKYGVVDNLKEQTILYRQHGNNEAGAGVRYNKRKIKLSSFLNQFDDELRRFKDTTGLGFASWLYYRIKYFFYRHLK